jgi:hypothetical protein
MSHGARREFVFGAILQWSHFSCSMIVSFICKENSWGALKLFTQLKYQLKTDTTWLFLVPSGEINSFFCNQPIINL